MFAMIDRQYESREMKREKDFDVWMKRVNVLFSGRMGMDVRDVEDFPFRDWFDCGVTPKGAMGRMVRSIKSDW